MVGLRLRIADATETVTTVVRGLEWVLAAEIESACPPETEISMARRRLIVRTPIEPASALALACADDVFLLVAEIDGLSTDRGALEELAGITYQLDWLSVVERIRSVRRLPGGIVFDVVASVEGRPGFNRFDAERALGKSLASMHGWTFLERTASGLAPGTPEMTVRLMVEHAQVVVAVRLGARPLHRRPYKLNTARGSLHPPAAAAMVAMAGVERGLLLDPFCGDGTIVIEAGLIRPDLTLHGSDIDARRIANAEANAARAPVFASFACRDAGLITEASIPPVDLIVTNPPWRRNTMPTGRLKSSFERFWSTLPALLSPDGILCVVVDDTLDLRDVLERQSWSIGLEQRVRLAGRVAAIILARPGPRPELPPRLRDWRDRADAAGVVTTTGFR